MRVIGWLTFCLAMSAALVIGTCVGCHGSSHHHSSDGGMLDDDSGGISRERYCYNQGLVYDDATHGCVRICEILQDCDDEERADRPSDDEDEGGDDDE